ncbi:MAG TPA: RagB/SusD family nutrient uptake outer membrane protein [Niabella sp.]|nr:RagB/SusD family nutrient uptake outer membrane protein [Niabella sp.]HQW15088.1 RagB/SusD family nutrient uptake outer membrane protein [Niabella sp.]HQX20229.1 RagB/SusD family nutrient uptake outer membrane protein [Niabella sp.]HQX41308.1 RagB/SusD family nutrient uptake outer membrane protein [Niabella sp.]HRB07350.1 RagB/SusD family nutrient uptake outer membrane protein [Niabella sp.]
MKKIKIFCSFILAVSLLGSCKQEFLEDMKSFDKYDESIFANDVLTGWYIDRLFYDYFAGYKSPIVSVIGLYNDTRTRSTEEMGGTVTDWINSQKTLTDANQADGYYGTALAANASNTPYTRIRTANFLIEKIAEKGQSLTPEFKKRARGQMFFLRALQYFDLMRVYGGVPIVTSVQNASAHDASIQTPRAKTSELVAQISADFDSASALLPATWGAADYGRFTSGAALAMKSRVLLTAASPLFNSDWDNSGNDRWQKALDAGLAAETLLTSSGNGLYGSSAKDWAELWYKNDNSFNKEAIMVQLLSNSTATSGINSNGWERSIRVTKQTGAGGISAPKEMVDLFPLANGERPTAANGYDANYFFLNRDPRFYRTFAFSGMKWPTKEAPTETVWLYRWKYTGNKTANSDGNQVSSPVVVRKMTNPAGSSTVNGLAFSGTDIFEYRYAELLLNIAECFAAKGDIANAINYLGKIRARVGIPSANNYGIGTLTTKYAAIEACLYERRVELAYEGKRFWDLQRWMLYNDDAASGNNTCSKLGIAPLNGQARTGTLWQYKTIAGSSADPLTAARGTISVDPDAGDFLTQLGNLKTFFDNNITVVNSDQPLDKDGSGNPLFITFRQNYYISGLNTTALSLNPWLQQTIGWNDYSNAPGNFDYKQ